MVVITVENYKNAWVETIRVENERLFWVKMKDVQDGLVLKNIPCLVRGEICGIFETNDLTKAQKKIY